MKDEIELLLRRNLEERANEYLTKLSNPLATLCKSITRNERSCNR